VVGNAAQALRSRRDREYPRRAEIS
jgi:hypothetical protein